MRSLRALACHNATATSSRFFSTASSKPVPGSKGKVLLLYSGGLDTSVILKWLLEDGYSVVCYMANIGQPGENFDAAVKKGLTVGASNVIVDDIRKDFVDNFVYPMIQANGVYENVYLMGTSVARPAIVKNAMKFAKKEGCQFVSHGATGKGNDQVRFELGFYSLDPSIKCVVPWRNPAFFNRFPGRNEMIEYAHEHKIPVEATKKKPYSTDENLFHISYESGILEDPWASYPEDIFKITVDPAKAPNTPEDITIDFEKGIPVRVTNHTDGKVVTGSLELFLYLNELGGRHGVGRLDLVENRYVGIKSRGVYETPGGTILHKAHIDLEGVTMDREVRRLRDTLSARFSDLCYNGYWFSPEMDFVLDAVKNSQKRNSGSVKVQLYKGNVSMRGRKSPFSLYDMKLSSMTEAGAYNPLDAEGFIKINAIRLKAHHHREKIAASKNAETKQ